ncbi:MAG TPA: hypothetical protein VFO76_01455, partial [Candidatus Kapabacteria bacterium]|nr:hypothetical protein [Candidatus Kapabacteria bacterium]
DIHSTSIIPPGVVAEGTFNGTYPSHLKATANLKGSVRYVSLETGRQGFHIEGLNDAFAANIPNHKQNIDISLDGFPNPPEKRQIVKWPIGSYGSASTATSGSVFHDVVAESFWQDEYDNASDGRFLYIVWASTVNPGGTATKAIWAMAVDLQSTSTTSPTIAIGPFKVSGGTHGTTSAWCPTVACDVRNNTSGTSPHFFVSYIDAGNFVVVKEFTGTTESNFEQLQKSFADPINTSTTDNPTTATHARVVVSSVPGASPTVGVYVLYDQTGGIAHDLVLYKGITWGSPSPTTGKYIDGGFNTGTFKKHPFPVSSVTDNISGVNDEPITAFANPYDADALSTYNQFHCLYHPKYTTSLWGAKNPIVICRGSDDGFPSSGTPDTRVILNQSGSVLLSDPASYIGAVNQMGIHVHWRTSGGDHYYSRDLNRTFDEDIEENTLVTYTCKVADGSSHGGATSPTVLPGVTMTLWTDPNWILKSTLSGSSEGSLWQYLATTDQGILSFDGDDVILLVGDNPVGTAIGDAKFIMGTQTICLFPVLNTGQGITIHKGSSFDYYGLTIGAGTLYPVGFAYDSRNNFAAPPGQTVFQGVLGSPGSGAIKLEGVSGQRATLNLHGGAWFEINGIGTFESDFGDIESLFEPEIYPTWVTATTPQGATFFPSAGDFLNAPGSGKMLIFGPANITHTVVNSHEVNVTGSDALGYASIITVVGNSNNTSVSTISNSTFTNVGSTGEGRLVFYNSDVLTGFAEADLSSNTFSRFQTALYNPVNPVSITSCTYTNIFGAGIQLYRDRSLDLTYDHIHVSDCNFQVYLSSTSFTTPISGSLYGIYVAGFDSSLMIGTSTDPDYHPRLLLEDNTFTTTTTNTVDAAIFVDQSNASVQHNTIDQEGYEYGIRNVGGGSPSMTTLSFLCNNIISNSTLAGIYTSIWGGYSKLNEVSACGTGHIS